MYKLLTQHYFSRVLRAEVRVIFGCAPYLVHFNFVHLCTSKAQLTHKDSQDAVFIQNWEVYYTSGWLRSRNHICS